MSDIIVFFPVQPDGNDEVLDQAGYDMGFVKGRLVSW